MTRVRVEVSDEQRTDLAALRQLPGVKGYIKQGEQHQFIVGPAPPPRWWTPCANCWAVARSPSSPSVTRPAPRCRPSKIRCADERRAEKLADVFIPLIPAFIASGLITGIINLLKRPDIAGQLAVDYPNVLGLLAIFGSAVFAIMNILVGVNAARVFGGSQAMGGVMAGILSSPALAQITLFGEALQPGRGGVIAVLLVVALMCWVEKRLRTLLPESVELILNPLLTTLVTASLAILILQPIGGIISDAIAHGANLAIDKGGLLVGALLSGLFLPLVLSGLHQGLVPIHVELVQAHGSNPLLPIRRWPASGRWGRRWRCC